MKNLALILTLSLSTFLFVACDDDDDGGYSVSGVLTTLCEVEQECDGVDFDYNSVSECVTDRTPMGEKLLPEFGEALGVCYDGMTCTEYEDETCFEDNQATYCTTSADGMLETMCAVMLECENEATPSQEEIDGCVTMMEGQADMGMFTCFKPSALAAFEQCLTDGVPTCAETLMDDCMESELRIPSDDDM